MASEITLRRITEVLKGDTNPSDEDLLIRFDDINGQQELDQIKETVLKKKDSTSTAVGEDMESTTEEQEIQPSSESSSPQDDVLAEQEAGPQSPQDDVLAEQEASDESTLVSNENDPDPELADQEDEGWKETYKSITGLDPDEQGVTFEQAQNGFIPDTVKFRNLNYAIGKYDYKDTDRKTRGDLRKASKRLGGEIFAKGGIYYKNNYEKAQESLKEQINEPIAIPLEDPTLEDSSVMGEDKKTLFEIDKDTPTSVTEIKSDDKQKVLEKIQQEDPSFDGILLDEAVVVVKKEEQTGKKTRADINLTSQVDPETERGKTTSIEINELEKEIKDLDLIIENEKALGKAETDRGLNEKILRREDKIQQLDLLKDVTEIDEVKEVVVATYTDDQGNKKEVVVEESVMLPTAESTDLSETQEVVLEETKRVDKEVKKDEFKEKVKKHKRLYPDSDITTKYNISEVDKAFDETESGEAPTKILDTTIGDQIITSNEEESVPFFNSIYNDYGIEADQSGVGDSMIVKAVDEDGNVTNEITIDLDIARTDSDLGFKALTGGGEGDLALKIVDPNEQRNLIKKEKEKLKNFIEENARKERTEIQKVRSEVDEQIDLEEIKAIRKNIIQLEKELVSLNNDYLKKLTEQEEEANELKDIASDPNSSFNEVQQAAEDYQKSQDEIEKTRQEIIAKAEVMDELQDEADAIIAQRIEYYRKYQIETGPYEMNLSDEYAFWTQTFIDAVQDPLLGAYIHMLDLLQTPFSGGLTEDQRNQIRKDADDLRNFLGLKGDIPAEKIEAIRRQGNWGRQLLIVLDELAGNAAAVFLTLGPGAVPVMINALPASSASMVYERLSERMDLDPLFDDVPEYQKLALKTAVGIAIFYLDRLGLKLATGRLGEVLEMLLAKYFKDAGRKSTLPGLLKYIEEIFSNPNKVARIAIAGAGEGSTEVGQGWTQKGLQEIFNEIQKIVGNTEEELFTEAEQFNPSTKKFWEDTALEFSLGFAAGAIVNTALALSGKSPNDIATDDQIKAALTVSQDEDIKSAFETKLKVEIAKGNIRAKEANDIMNEIDKVKAAYDQTGAFPDLSPDEKLQVARKILEINELEEQRSKATNKRTQKGYDGLISIKQAEIDAIVDKAKPKKDTKTGKENNVSEAEEIVQEAIDEGRDLTLEDLSKVVETLPDLDIDISTDRDISPEELLTKIKEYAVPGETTDSLQDQGDAGQEGGPTSEMEVSQPEEAIKDDGEVDDINPMKSGIDFKSIAQSVNNWFMGRDKSGNPNPKNFLDGVKKLFRVLATAKRYLPQRFKNIVESEINYRSYQNKRGADLVKKYNNAISKIKDSKKRKQAKTASELYLNGIVPKEFFEGSKSKEEVLNDIENEIADAKSKIKELENDKKGKTQKEKDIIDSRIANLEDRLEKIENFKNDKAFDDLTPESMPDDLYQSATEMRELVDELTEIIINEDLTLEMLGEDTKMNMRDNEGRYFRRSYQVYTDKNWYKKVTDDILQDAAQELYNKYVEGGLSHEAAIIETKKTIERYTSKNGKEILENGIKKPVTQKGKKRIPLKIRMLMGEFGDAVQNFTQTIQSQAAKAASLRAINSVIKMGEEEGIIFKTKEDAARAHPDGSHSNEFIIGGKTYYSNEGMVYELNETDSKKGKGRGFDKVSESLVKAWQYAVGKVKLGLTVYSPTTQAINFTGNSIIALNNGHFDVTQFKKTIETFKEDKDGLYNYLIKEGVINSSVTLEMVDDLLNSNNPDKYLDDAANDSNTPAKKLYDLLTKGPQKAYQAGDDFWKIYGFMNEATSYSRALYDKPYSELSEEEKSQVDKKAAENVKNIYPNYSQISEFIRKFKAVPVASPFLSFTYESFRIQIKNLQLAYQELADPNPKVKAIGMKRLIGISAASAGIAAIVASAQDDEGMDRDTIEGKAKYDLAKRYTFPWQENSDIVPMSIEDGVFKYVDATASNPFGPSVKMMNAYDPEKDLMQNLPNLIKVSGMENFMSGDILASAILSIEKNQSDYGGEIYNPEDNQLKILNDIGAYLFRKTQPGVIKFARKSKDMGYSELGMSIVGAKPYEVDMKKQFGFKAAGYKYGDKKRNIKRAADDFIKDELKKQGYSSIDDYIEKNTDEVTKAFEDGFIDDEGYLLNKLPSNVKEGSVFGIAKSFQKSYDDQNKKYKDMVHELHLDYKSLVEVGQVSEEKAVGILRDKGFNAKEIQQIVSDAPRDFKSNFISKIYSKVYSDLIQKKKEDELTEEEENFLDIYRRQRQRFPSFDEEEKENAMIDAGLDPEDENDKKFYNEYVDTEGNLYPDKVDIDRFKKKN